MFEGKSTLDQDEGDSNASIMSNGQQQEVLPQLRRSIEIDFGFRMEPASIEESPISTGLPAYTRFDRRGAGF